MMTHEKSASVFECTAFKQAALIINALKECDPKLREVAEELFQQLRDEELDHEQALATTALIAEILFPNSDSQGSIGLDLVEAEKIAISIEPAAKPLLAKMDEQEQTFAERLRTEMEKQEITQAELASRVGIGQPAISMMLNRTCRPQRKTVQKIAEALKIAPEQLWPT